MTIFYTVREIPMKTGPDLALHRFPTPSYSEPGWYRIGRSLNAFRSGKQKGCTPEQRSRHYDSCGWDHARGVLYSLKREEEQFRENAIMMESMEAVSPETAAKLRAQQEAVPVIEHASLYDFYDFIGFDRHKRRYTGKRESIRESSAA